MLGPRGAVLEALQAVQRVLEHGGDGLEWSQPAPAPDFAAQLRSDALDNYDFGLPPSGVARDPIYRSDAGTDVGIQIRFFKVDQINSAEGAMKIKVWYRLSWIDPRLAWDPADYGNITTTYYMTSEEHQEIWLPDVVPVRRSPPALTPSRPRAC